MRLPLAVLFLAFFTRTALADRLSGQEAAKLKSDIAAMFVTFEKDDPTWLIANAHESVLAEVGGEQRCDELMRETVQQLQQLGRKFVSAEVGTPTQIYAAGDEEVCFVPGGGPWKYLDAAGLRKNPGLLGILLPKLPGEVSLPPDRVPVL